MMLSKFKIQPLFSRKKNSFPVPTSGELEGTGEVGQGGTEHVLFLPVLPPLLQKFFPH